MEVLQLTETDDILDLCSDPVFKAVFTRDDPDSRGALMSLLTDYTGRKVTTVAVKENEPAISDIGDRLVRFDINVKFNNGKLANIEMNMFPHDYDLERAEWYLAELHTTQSIKGKDRDYGDINESWQISFFNERKFFEDGAIVHHFEYYDETNETALGGKTHLVTVELGKAKELSDLKAGKKEDLWAYFIRHCQEQGKRGEINAIIRKEGGMRMAMETLLTISKDENERAKLLTIKKNILDWQSGIVSARKEERKKSAAHYEPIISQKDMLLSQKTMLLSQQAAEIAALKKQLGQK
jgi:hypothetical protein